MPIPLHAALRRRAAALLAAPLLLGSAAAALSADRVAYRDTYYSDASHTTIVGKGVGFCDGDYTMISGYQTAYFTTAYAPPCP